MEQGVLVVESSSAKIESNFLDENIEANIAFGGKNSVDTLIVDNKIHRSLSAGIYLVEGGEAWLLRNDI